MKVLRCFNKMCKAENKARIHYLMQPNDKSRFLVYEGVICDVWLVDAPLCQPRCSAE